MKTKTHFALVDVWDDTGHSIVEHVAGVSLPGGFLQKSVIFRPLFRSGSPALLQ
jgi:hypothetical protein